MAALIALILFVLASFGLKFDSFNIVWMGLAFLALAMIVGNWPFGYIIHGRNRQ